MSVCLLFRDHLKCYKQNLIEKKIDEEEEECKKSLLHKINKNAIKLFVLFCINIYFKKRKREREKERRKNVTRHFFVKFILISKSIIVIYYDIIM